MAETIKGKLIWKGEGRDRKRLLSWGKKDGEMTMPNRFAEAQLAASLRDSKESEIEVELELENGQPRRIRAVGEEWKGPAVAVSPTRAERRVPRDDRDSQRREDGRSQRPDSQTRRENMQGDQATTQDLPPEFHNPYNFIPAIPRDELNGTDNDLRDREPSGHDRFLPDRYSGKLPVKMTVITPLLLPDTARVEVTGEHKCFSVRVCPLLEEQGDEVRDATGQTVEVPDINPTAVKGMLRSAYEAITNSRISVFRGHEHRMAFRGEAKMPKAARIENNGKGLVIRKFSKVATLVRYRKHFQGERDKLERASHRDAGRALPYQRSTLLPQHKDAVWVRTSPRYTRTGRPIGSQVDEIQPRELGSSPPTGFEAGWVCITGANTKDKVYERVFVENSADEKIPLSPAHEKMWNELISNYQNIHEQELRQRKKNQQQPNDYLGNNPGDTAWSRHIFNDDDLELKDGTLCYVIEEGRTASAVLPVMISRRLHQFSPDRLLHDSLKPVAQIEDKEHATPNAPQASEMSPADRVFGCVRQERINKKGGDEEFTGKVVAYRGQLRIGTVQCKKDADGIAVGKETLRERMLEIFGDEKSSSDWFPLNILGQPKPQQGRFYVADTEQGEAQTQKRNNEAAGFKEGRGLRGRKVYPHHAKLPDGYWVRDREWKEEKVDANRDLSQEPLTQEGRTFFREYVRPKSEKRRDSQNRSIQGWVKKGVEFEFDLHFTNLSTVELGALIWLLKLNDGLEEATYFHRFGGGKPFGFGSVHLSLEDAEITSGEDLNWFYQSLDDPPKKSVTAEQCKASFERAYQSAGYQRIIEAFKRACAGFETGRPIHYPRARHYKEVKQRIDGRWQTIGIQYEENQSSGESPPPHKDGLAYEWFVENAKEKIEVKGADGRIELLPGIDVIRPRLNLQSLAEDDGLPILPHKI